MGPIDYLSAFPQADFTRSLMGGLQAGSALQQTVQAREAQERAQALAQQYQADLSTAMRAPSARGFAELALKYPQHREAFKQGWETLNTDQQQSNLRDATELAAALGGGRGDVALQKIDARIEAAKNSGEDVSTLQFLREQVQADPQKAFGSVLHVLSGLPGSDKVLENLSRIGVEQRAAANAPADKAIRDAEARIKGVEAANAPEAAALKNTDTRSQIAERAQRLRLDQDKLTSDIELKLHELGQKATTLGDDAKKLINDSTIAAVSADQAAGQMLDLAGRLEKEGGGYGAAARASEWLKAATGQQDALSLMRAEYTKLRNTQAAKNLPPGAASDADVKLAMQGFPPETADAKLLAGFLRGMAKLQQIDSVAKSADAEWVNAVGHRGKPKADIEIDGIKVPAGSTFVDFMRQFTTRRADDRAAAQAQEQVKNRPYMRWAQPQGASGAY